MTFPRVGILGGMGPAATILLQQRVLEATPVMSDDGHIPLLIDMNPQVPSRIEYLIHNRGQNPGPVLAQIAKGLESNSVDLLAMPCCTAHHFADHITDSVSVPFLNMVQLTASTVARQVPSNAWVGILASPATEKVGLFRDALKSHGLTPIYPKDSGKMLEAIEGIKANGPRAADTAIVQSAINELTADGVDAFIVGCSEFSLISRKLNAAVPIVDAIDELTKAIVGFAESQSELLA